MRCRTVVARTGVGLLAFSASIFLAQSVARAANSIQHGVYTVKQASEGKAIYNHECVTCHGAALEGKGQNPPLKGDDFLNNWQGQTLADLYTQMHSTMPATKPGSLTPLQTTQLLAYILKANEFPSGRRKLPADPEKLKAIQIVKPHGKS